MGKSSLPGDHHLAHYKSLHKDQKSKDFRRHPIGLTGNVVKRVVFLDYVAPISVEMIFKTPLYVF